MADKIEEKVADFFTFSVDKKENTPVFAATKAAWILHGDDNDYYGYLVDLMNTSSKHGSLVKKKVNMTAGGGFVETPALKEFLDNSTGDEDLNDIAFKLAYDLNCYGGFSFSVTWNNERTATPRKTFVDHSKVRLAKMVASVEDETVAGMYDKQQDGVDFYYISSDWTQHRKVAHKPVLWQGFSEKYRKEENVLFSVNEYRTGVEFYTYPDYISAVNWIELDKEIANYHLSSAKNGFTPSLIISFRGGVPTDKAQREIKKKLKKQYGGTDNASEVFVTFSKDVNTSPEFIPVNLNASDERFIQLEESITQNIIIAHGASPVVAGIATAGKLGSSDEIIESEQMFQHNVIDAKQKLIERQFNRLAALEGIVDELELQSFATFTEAVIETEDGEPVDIEAEAKANLRGSVGGVTGILDIAAQVTAGTISASAGKSILVIIFGLKPEEAAELLGGVEEKEEVKDANE
tara:strand:- start:55 stop:1446 length:1392 start_codon:yes stop_codon:yes gene_type:complete